MISLFSKYRHLSLVLLILFLACIANAAIVLMLMSNKSSSFVFHTVDNEVAPVRDEICIDEPLVIIVKGVNKGGWAISTYAETIYDADTLNFAKVFPQPDIAVSGLIDNTAQFSYPIFVDTTGLLPGSYIYSLSTAQETRNATGFFVNFSIVNCNP